ncbi:MAG: YhjD/YihY/BrkB family envelope integrity protein [Acidimicrobiia bacterium]|nr:YhjD/YihY/BrkB family envelope integrity protein [Acidimicrobiia bacterium]
MVELRSRHHAIDVAVETLDGWRRHLSGRNASLLSFFFFLSIFPLLLAATTVLGLVLEDNPDLQERIVDGALAELPVLGSQLQSDPSSLDGNLFVLLFGLVLALWSATKAFVALHGALDDTWEIPVDERASMPVQRALALLGILILGLAQLASLASAVVVQRSDLHAVGDWALIAASAAINAAALLLTYRYLTSASPTWRQILPGALVAALMFTLIQQFGSALVSRITQNASDTYGQFALVLGIVTWLSLLAITALMAAEYNAARVRLTADQT